MSVDNASYPTKIFAVSVGEYSDYYIECLFSSEERAKEYIRVSNSFDKWRSSRRVEEFILDEPREQWIKTIVRMKKNGDVVNIWHSVDRDRGFSCYDIDGNLVYSVATDEKERAIKKTNEIRSILIAHNIFGNVIKTQELLYDASPTIIKEVKR